MILRSLPPWGAALLAAVCLSTNAAAPASALDVDLTVRERGGADRVAEIVTTGVPIPRGELASDQQAAIAGVDGQFRTLATWGDGSVKWLLCSFPATVTAHGTAHYRLVNGPGDSGHGALSVTEGAGTVTVTTGPLRFVVKSAAFNLFDRVWLDSNGDGAFAPSEEVVTSRPTNGSVVEDRDGDSFTSAGGPPVSLVVEEAGPLRAVIRFDGVHGGSAGDHLAFSGRVIATRGRSDVVVQYSQRNPIPTDVINGQPLARWREGRGDHGGTQNSLWMEDLSLVTRVSLAGSPRYSLQGAAGSTVRTGPLIDEARLYQDSSGGPWWFVTEGTSLPGYELRHGGDLLESGDRAEGFADVSDDTKGLTVAIRHFWESFPNKVAVGPDGTVTIGVMPRDFSEPFEHRPGERKTHWTLFYFHDGDAVAAGSAEVARAFRTPLRAMADADWYASTRALNDVVPHDPSAWWDYEDHNYYAAHGFLESREDSDFWSWQDFGDLWSDFEGGGDPPNTNRAANNLEYDSGWAFVLQALRTAGRDDELSNVWWNLASAGNEHQADIDVYHVQEGPLSWIWGGMWTHTAHGRSGRSDPHRGDSPNLAHSWNRGMLAWYYLSGDRNVLDAALLVGENVAWRVENGPDGPGYSNTDGEARAPGHALQVLTDMYLHTWDERYADAARRVVEESHASTKEYVQHPHSGDWSVKPWMVAILMKSLGRWVDVMAEEKGIAEQSAIQSLLLYADFLDERGWVDRAGDLPGYLHYEVFSDGSAEPGGVNVDMWTARASDAFVWALRHTGDDARRDRYRWIAQQAFEDGSRHPWCWECPNHRYTQAKVHQVLASSGQEWMVEQQSTGPGDTEPPAAIADLAALEGIGEGEIDLAWTAPGDDGGSGQAASYRVRMLDREIGSSEDWDAATPVGGAPVPAPAGSPEAMTVVGIPPGEDRFFCVRAVDDAGNVGGLSNSPGAPGGRDRTAPVITGIRAREVGPGTVRFRWTTNEPATSAVKWDVRMPSSNDLANVIEDEDFVTTHRMTLVGQRTGTTVWYRVQSNDAAGNHSSGPLQSIRLQLTDLPPREPVGVRLEPDPAAPAGLVVEAWEPDSGVLLRWSPVEGTGVAGYRVHRRVVGAGPDAGWEELTAVPVREAAFRDRAPPGIGAVEYAVTAVGVGTGESPLSPPVRFDPVACSELRLSSRPNPLERGGGTSFVFGLPHTARGPVRTTLAVFDLAGRRVRGLFRGNLAPGEEREVRWDATDGRGRPVAAGVYYARLGLATGEVRLRRLVVLR